MKWPKYCTLTLFLCIFIGLAVGGLLLFGEPKPTLLYKTYTNKELQFQIDYPSEWTITAGRLGDLPRTPFVEMNGALFPAPFQLFHSYKESCDEPNISAGMNISISPGSVNDDLSGIRTEKDIRDFFTSKNIFLEEIRSNSQSLIVGRAYTGSGMCDRSVFIAWTLSGKGRLYELRFDGDRRATPEELYPVAKRMFQSFRLME